MQFLVNTTYSFLVLALVASSFFVVFKPSHYFHLSHAATIALGAYIFFYVHAYVMPSILLSALAALAATTLFGVANEALFYRRLARSSDPGINVLVLSLGVYLIVQNVISVIFGNEIRLLDPCNRCLDTPLHLAGGTISATQTLVAGVATFVLLLLCLIWYRTDFGKAARAISENRELAAIIGIPVDKVILRSIALGSVAAGIAGMLIALDVGITPTSGFSYLLYAVIAMIIGGNNSLVTTLLGALALALFQSVSGYFIDSKWSGAFSFGLLIVFLMIRPQGVRSISLGAELR